MKSIPRSGKRLRPKTAVHGKRYRCAGCHTRSPRPVKKPAPWWCPRCLARRAAAETIPDTPPPAWTVPSPPGDDGDVVEVVSRNTAGLESKPVRFPIGESGTTPPDR